MLARRRESGDHLQFHGVLVPPALLRALCQPIEGTGRPDPSNDAIPTPHALYPMSTTRMTAREDRCRVMWAALP